LRRYSEVMQLIDHFQSTGMAPPAFACAVPNNWQGPAQRWSQVYTRTLVDGVDVMVSL